jgi:hypothetical protein
MNHVDVGVVPRRLGEAQWRPAVGFPSLQRHPLNRTRVRMVGSSSGSEPRSLCRGSHPFYMALRDRVPPAIYWVGPPIMERSRARLAFGPTGGDQTNILPLDLILCLLNLSSLLGTHFITNNYTEHGSS